MQQKRYMLAALVSILIRFMLGMWSYSGYGKPPMFGDFEAQRHWLELTIALPIGDWYRHTADNDLLYWGLDYPPLTAYGSYLFGTIAAVVYPPLVEFKTSHGHESIKGKLFMRMTVVLLDIILYIPLIKKLMTTLYPTKNQNNHTWYFISTLVLLLTPSLLLIDHGHFQYNSVSIGLALYALYFIVSDWDVLGSICFCLSLNYKQMALYYSPVFFFLLLRKCYDSRYPIWHFAKISLTVTAVFAALWSPFCLFHSSGETCLTSLGHVLHRQFPFARGIFEDKVSNIWYTLSVIVDYRKLLSTQSLAVLSIELTLILMSPACYYIFVNGTRQSQSKGNGLTYGLIVLANCALSYFLASFQVHEKSLLLVLVPLSLLTLDNPWTMTWIQHIGTWTMFPLLIKDQLRIPYVIVSVLYSTLVAGSTIYQEPGTQSRTSLPSLPRWKFVSFNLFITLSYLGMLLLHVLELILPPPFRLPDLYAALFAIYGTVNLIALYVLTLYWISRFHDNSNEVSEERQGKRKTS